MEICLREWAANPVPAVFEDEYITAVWMKDERTAVLSVSEYPIEENEQSRIRIVWPGIWVTVIK